MFYRALNCWFCNENTYVVFYKQNSWTCSHCDQYNGFKKDGDYNRDIIKMHEETDSNSVSSRQNNVPHKSTNCLCERCNFYQQLKIEKLSKFEAKDEKYYDLEIKLYKEYLEKVYTLCTQCQSKVKFEITKQDGILKQYLLNLGMFNSFFEPRKSTVNPKPVQAHLPLNKADPAIDTLIGVLKVFLLTCVFFLATLVMVYNKQETSRHLNLVMPDQKLVSYTADQFTCSNQNQWFSTAHFNRNYLIEFIREFVYTLTQYQNQFTITRDTLFTYFNDRIPMCLALVYFLTCFLIVTWPRNEVTTDNTNLNLVSLIALIDLLMIVSNYNQFSKYFKTSYSEELTGVTLSFVYVCMPLIQLAIILQLAVSCYKWSKKFDAKKKPCEASFIERSSKPQANNYQSPFNSPTSNTQAFSSPSNSHVQFNYSFVTPNSYSLMKYISNCNMTEQPRDPYFLNTNSRYQSPGFARSASSIIKPAKLTNQVVSTNCETSFQMTPKLEKNFNWRKSMNSMEDMSDKSFASDESDEGSIVSGLTNLYLGRDQKMPQLFQSISNYELKPLARSCSDEKPLRGRLAEEDQYSFYQTDTNPSNGNHSIVLNKIPYGSASVYQNGADLKNLQMLKFYE